MTFVAELLVENPIPRTELSQDAERSATFHTSATSARSLDIQHAAAAQRLGADEFVTFDHRQAALGNRIELSVAAL